MPKTKKKPKQQKSDLYDLQGSIILLHGPYKIGKTTLISSFPEVCIIATEPGHKYVPSGVKERLTRLRPGADGWEDFKALIEPHGYEMGNITTIAIDVIDGLYNSCYLWVCRENKWKAANTPGHGQGWEAIRMEFTAQMEKLTYVCEDNNITLIFVSHTKEEEVEIGVSTLTKYSITLPNHAKKVIGPLPDHVWYLGYFNDDVEPDVEAVKKYHDRRTLWFKGGDLIEAGCQDSSMRRKRIKFLNANNQYEQIVTEMAKKPPKK